MGRLGEDEVGLCPEIGKGLVELFKQRPAPLRIGPRGVETDHVMFGDHQIKARRQFGENLPTDIAGGWGIG